MKNRILFFFITSAQLLFSQVEKDEVLEKMRIKDSLASENARKLYGSNLITGELHNAIFRNIYRISTYNEEQEFQKKLEQLKPFEDLKIDTIIIRTFKIFGENIFDTTQKGSRLENFLSDNIHVNTKHKIIRNRFLLFKKGDYFSAYRALENARLIRSSRIFHDVRFVPINNANGNIDLHLYVQDVFPYGFDLGFSSFSNFTTGIENVNILGLGHQLNLNFRLNQNDPRQKIGGEFVYTIPNIFNGSFLDYRAFYQNYTNIRSGGMRLSREFSRPEFRWAGGAQIQIVNQDYLPSSQLLNDQRFETDVWISRAFPINSIKNNWTQNAIVLGARNYFWHHFRRPENYIAIPEFWNKNGVLGSLGYNRVKYVQDRLLNGFGLTEDVPIGFSTNILFGRDFTEFGNTTYSGLQFLAQAYNKKKAYINIGLKFGINSYDRFSSDGVFDFQFQSVSPVFKWGKMRQRNFFRTRYTIGVNQSEISKISLTRNDGIRGIDNFSYQGSDRLTFSLQNNLFMPFSFLGFRSYIYTLFELAMIKEYKKSYGDSHILGGATLGISTRNENLIFSVIQLQYGYYPSFTALSSQTAFTISTSIPFNFQGLDISKPNKVEYR